MRTKSRTVYALGFAVLLLGAVYAVPKFAPQAMPPATPIALLAPPQPLPDEGPMPPLTGASAWLNSPPLTTEGLRGKVVLIDFWTYSCVNCLRALPYVKAWNAKYRDQGLVVIGVHTPEFDFEHDTAHVAASLRKLGITYPVAMDNDMTIWNAFKNQYWPAHYFVDVHGRIRHHHFGEGAYEESERVIRQLLAEVERDGASRATHVDTATMVVGTGEQAASNFRDVKSPETYLGYARAERFVATPAMVRDQQATYTSPSALQLNTWALGGTWTVTRQYAQANATNGTITFRFHARDVNLVLGPGGNGQPVSFRVLVDGKAPGADAGMDVSANGDGTVTGYRLYQLVRQRGAVQERTVTITFTAPGVRAYAFTFG